MLLHNKTAIIYGAGGAVGGAVAKAFAREGARLFLAGRSAAPLARITADLAEAGHAAEFDIVDATDPDAVARHLSSVITRDGRVRLMFNAIGWGGAQGETLTEMPFENLLDPVRTALTSWFHTGTILARHMGESGGGTILGISANAGREAYARVGGFGIACAAVEHFLRQLAVEEGPRGVRVCWVRSPGSPDAPGVREAWMLQARERGMSFDEIHREFARDTPLRRITGLAQVADAAVLLGSDLAAGMTATMANATGGAQVD